MLSDVLLDLHRDIADYLRLVPGLSGLPVFDMRTTQAADGSGGAVQDLIDDALSAAAMHSVDGKSGLAIMVLMPDVEPANANLPGPVISVVCVVRVFENRIVNESPSGFGLSASRVAVHIARALHHWSPTGAATLVPATTLIQDISLPDTEGMEITFTIEFALPPEPRCSQPALSVAEVDGDAVVTLSTATSGADLYYTLDGRLPGPGTGTLYTAPFTVTTTAKLRALAAHDDLLPSAVSEALITIS